MRRTAVPFALAILGIATLVLPRAVTAFSTDDRANAEEADRAGPRPRHPYWSVPFFDPRLPPYALDTTPRFQDPRAPIDCPYDDLVRHRGTHVRYLAPARVHAAFVPRLEAFEALVVEVGTAHFGRAPRRIVHKGAFNCRRTRGRSERVSEHALGNALDLRGFDFGRLPRDATAGGDLPRRLQRAFQVRVGAHWSPRRAGDVAKARFLHDLVERLRTTRGIFRGIVGPPHRRHHDHLHLDAAPWRYALYRIDPLPDAP